MWRCNKGWLSVFVNEYSLRNLPILFAVCKPRIWDIYNHLWKQTDISNTMNYVIRIEYVRIFNTGQQTSVYPATFRAQKYAKTIRFFVACVWNKKLCLKAQRDTRTISRHWYASLQNKCDIKLETSSINILTHTDLSWLKHKQQEA